MSATEDALKDILEESEDGRLPDEIVAMVNPRVLARLVSQPAESNPEEERARRVAALAAAMPHLDEIPKEPGDTALTIAPWE